MSGWLTVAAAALGVLAADVTPAAFAADLPVSSTVEAKGPTPAISGTSVVVALDAHSARTALVHCEIVAIELSQRRGIRTRVRTRQEGAVP